MKIPVPVLITVGAGSLVAAGASSYVRENATKQDDGAEHALGLVGLVGTFGAGIPLAITAERAATRAGAGVPLRGLGNIAGVGLAGAAASLLGSQLAGGGSAKPVFDIGDHPSEKLPDGTSAAKYLARFDNYDQHGAQADDGVLTTADVKELRKDWSAHHSG